MGPGSGEVGTEHCIGDEEQRNHRHDQSGGAARRLQHKNDEDDADSDVHAIGRRGAICEIVAARQRVSNRRDRENAGNDVPPAHAVAKPRGERKQQEGQNEGERHMRVTQFLRRHDCVGRIEMKQAHRDGDVGDRLAGQPAEPVGRAFICFDEFFCLAQGLVGNDHLVIPRRFIWRRHAVSPGPHFMWVIAAFPVMRGPFVGAH